MGTPEGSCGGSGGEPTTGSERWDAENRKSGTCPVCFGRFRLLSEAMIPHHSPMPESKRDH